MKQNIHELKQYLKSERPKPRRLKCKNCKELMEWNSPHICYYNCL